MTTKTKALSLLARQPYTSKRLADKLYEKDCPQHEVDETIEWCIGEGYLNDSEWAGRKAAQKAAKGWETRKIAAYLRYYGISRQDITDALNALETDEYE
ncbi:MAG: recombination regulator RecX [Oscillospiraceae bacterium]|nr:recombination regulator RecX [Oscillospiraceae bacterium]